MVIRYSKIIMCFCLALHSFLISFGNITDYDSNFKFVQHVLEMDTIFPDNALKYRAVINPTLHTLSYWVIITGEVLTFLFFFLGGIALWNVRKQSGKSFDKAKKIVIIASTLGFLVWFLGFMVVGGEWFAMWQSKIWNGQQAAFRFYITILAVLIFIVQPDQDLHSNKEL